MNLKSYYYTKRCHEQFYNYQLNRQTMQNTFNIYVSYY